MAIEVNLLNNNNTVGNINTNMQRIKEALQDGVSRSGNTPNQMDADLDMDGNNILNVGMIDASSYLFNGEDLLDSELIADGVALAPFLEEIVPITNEIVEVAGISVDIINISNNISDISNFGDVYLGAKSTEPTTRNDGSPLQAGDLYFDQTDNVLHYYNGSAWVDSTEQGLNLGTNYFVGDGVETDFVAGSTIAQAQNAFVWVGGVRQRPNIDYTVSGSTISFVTPPTLDEEIDVLILALVNEIDIGVPSNGTVDSDSITDSPVEQAAILTKLNGQPYDVNTAKTDVTQTWSAPQEFYSVSSIKGTGLAGSTQAYLSFEGSDDVRIGFVGAGSNSNSNVFLSSDSGDIILDGANVLVNSNELILSAIDNVASTRPLKIKNNAGTQTTSLGPYQLHSTGSFTINPAINASITPSNVLTLASGSGNTIINSGAILTLDGTNGVRSATIYNTTTATGANVALSSSNGTLARSTSAAKYKTNFQRIAPEKVSVFLQLIGGTYNSLCPNDDPGETHAGVIADQADQLGLTDLVTYNEEGEVEGFRYERSTAYFLEAFRLLSERVEALEKGTAE